MTSISNTAKLFIFMSSLLLAALIYYFLKPEKTTQELLLERGLKIRELQAAGKNKQAMKLYQKLMTDAFKGEIKLAGSVVDA